MKQVMTVFRYTFKEAVHKKSFKISSIVLFAGILLIFVLIAALSGTGTGTDADAAPGEAGYRLYYIDEQGLIPGRRAGAFRGARRRGDAGRRGAVRRI